MMLDEKIDRCGELVRRKVLAGKSGERFLRQVALLVSECECRESVVLSLDEHDAGVGLSFVGGLELFERAFTCDALRDFDAERNVTRRHSQGANPNATLF